MAARTKPRQNPSTARRGGPFLFRETAPRMQLHEVEITDLSHDGRGVARVDGKTVFVAGALPGERAGIQVTSRHRSFDEAKVETLLTR